MQNINLYRLMSGLYARPEVEDADIVSCMYEDDTLKTVMLNGPVVAIGVQDEYPSVALYTIYASDEDYRNKEPLIEGLYYDFEDDSDYKDGVEDIIKEACWNADCETSMTASTPDSPASPWTRRARCPLWHGRTIRTNTQPCPTPTGHMNTIQPTRKPSQKTSGTVAHTAGGKPTSACANVAQAAALFWTGTTWRTATPATANTAIREKH